MSITYSKPSQYHLYDSLNNQSIKIPDTCFMVENVECCITNFICSGIQLDEINSQYVPPTSLSLELQDLESLCSGNWKYGRLDGLVVATISKTDIFTTFMIHKETIFPKSLTFPSCSIPSITIDLKFSGGLVGALLQLISGIVEDVMKNALYKIFCKTFEPTIADSVTDTFGLINPVLQTIVSYGPSSPPEFPQDIYIDWNTFFPPLFDGRSDDYILQFFDKVIDTFTDGTGSLHFDLHNLTIDFPLNFLNLTTSGTITIILHSFDLFGLDSLYNIRLLSHSSPSSPSYSPYCISSTISANSLSLSLSASIISKSDHTISTDPFSFEFELGDTHLGLDLLIPIVRNKFEELSLNQLFHIDCLLSTADTLSILSLALKTQFSNIQLRFPENIDGLAGDLETLINNLLQLSVNGFSDLLRDLVSGIAQGPVKFALNQKLENILNSSKGKCSPTPSNDDSEQPNYVVWSESNVLEIIDYTLNTLVGVTGINNLITVATGGTGSVTIPVADSSLSLFGLNTFYQFLLLTPSLDLNLPYNLDSIVALGYCEGHSRNQICTPFGFSLSFTSPADISSSLIAANLYNLDISLSLLAKLNSNDILDIQVSDTFLYSGNHSGCLLSAFDTLAVTAFDMSISEASLTKGPVVTKDITDVVKKILDAITSDKSVDAINWLLSHLLADSEIACETGSWPIPHNDDDNDDQPPIDECYDPVQCGLNQLVIGPFPDLCVNITPSLFICVKQFSCSGINVKGIVSENISPQNLMLGVDDFAITCGADLSIAASFTKFPKSITYEGSFSISMTNFSGSVEAVFGSTSSTSKYPPLPDSVSFTNCQTSHANFHVSFKGGLIGDVLDKVLSIPLEEALESAVYWALCDVLNPLLGHVITKLFANKIDPKIREVIDMSIPPPPVVMSGYLDWNNTLIGKLHHLIDFMKVNQAKILRCMIDSNGINPMSSLMSNDLGVLDIYLNIPIYLGEYTVFLNVLTISGLNSIGELKFLSPASYSGVTLSSAIDFDIIEFQLSIKVKDQSGNYEQDAVLDLILRNVTTNFDIVAAIRLSILNDLYSDQLLHLPCLMSTLDAFYINSLVLNLNVDDLSISQISGGDATSLEKDTADLITNLFDLLLNGYPLMVTEMISGIFQGPVKDNINSKIEEIISTYKSSHICTNHGNYTGVEWIEWSKSNLIQKIDYLINDMLGSEGMNEFIGCLTNNTGSVSFLFPASSPIFAGWKLSLGGLDSFSDFALLYPLIDAPYDLANSISFGDCNLPQNCHNFTVGLEGYESNGEFSRVLLEVTNLKIFLDFLLELDIHSLKNLRYEDLHSKGCFVSTIDRLSFQSLSIAARSVKFYFLNGSSMTDISTLINKVFSKLSDPETLATLDQHIQDYLINANILCTDGYIPNNVDDDAPSSSALIPSWKLKIVVLIICSIFCGYILSRLLQSFGIVYINSDQKHHSDIFDSPSIQSVIFFSNAWWNLHVKKIFCISNSRKVPNDATEDDDTMADVFIYDALIASDALSPFIRVSIPLVIVGLAVTFVFSLLKPAANVMMEIRAGNRILGDAAIFHFGYGGTVHDLWIADAYFLSVIIALFTGVWPFIKLVLLLFAWILPTSIFMLEYRDLILRWVDILGKWSLVDTFVMVLMMVAFHVKFAVVPGVTIALTVAPQWQFYSFMGATMGSLVLGHIALACHRAVSETPILVDQAQEEGSESMMNHSFSVQLARSNESNTNHELVQKKISFTSWGKFAVLLILSLGLFLVVNGILLKSVTFQLRGLTGYLMEDPTSSYSLLEVGLNIPPASGMPSNFGVRFIQFSYFLFSITIPIAFVFMLIILWIFPFKLSTQKSLILGIEMLNAWSALDVFVLSIIASVLEIQQYAKFLIGDHCDAINQILQEEMDSELNGDDTCFDVVARMKTDSTVVCLAALFLIFVGLPFISLSHQTIAERLDEDSKDNDSVDQWTNQERKTSMSSHHSRHQSIDLMSETSLTEDKHSGSLSSKMKIMSSSIYLAEYLGLLRIHDQDSESNVNT